MIIGGRRHVALPEPSQLLEVLAINIITPAGCTAGSAAAAMLVASHWLVAVPAIQGCLIVGAGGVLLDWVMLVAVYLPAVALWQEGKTICQVDTYFIEETTILQQRNEGSST